MVASTPNSTARLLKTHRDLISSIRHNRSERAALIPHSEHHLPHLSPAPSPPHPPASPPAQPQSTLDISHIPEAKRRKYEAYYPTYCWDEETIRNDLSERYSVSGDWGGNFIHGAEEDKRCEEYPRQRRLLGLKSQLFLAYAHPPLFLPLHPSLLATSRSSPPSPSKPSVLPPAPSTLNHPLPPPPIPVMLPPPPSPLAAHLLQAIGQNVRFDSIHITPPPDMPWSEVLALPIRQISTEPGFVFLWVGKGGKEGGLERGREALTKWGFRKCEEIVWVKTNMTRAGGPGIDPPPESIFQNTKEHCLMGIRGTVRRATDGWFVHTNVDTDVIVWEGDVQDPHRKPPEMYSLIENFCLGLRRLDLFGDESRPRPGWVTAGFPSPFPSSLLPPPGSKPTVAAKLEAMVNGSPAADLGVQRFDKNVYPALVTVNGRHVLPSTNDIETLRPKSPNKGRPHSSQSTASTTLNNTPGASNRLSALPNRPTSSMNPPPINNPYTNMGGSFPTGMVMQNGMQGAEFLMTGGMGGGFGGGFAIGRGMPQQQQQQQQQQQHFLGAQQQFFPGGGGAVFYPQQQQQSGFAPQQQSFGQGSFHQNPLFLQQQYHQQQQQQQFGFQTPQQMQQEHQRMMQEQALMQQVLMMGQFPGDFGGGGGGAGGGGARGGGFNGGGQGGGRY